MKKGPRDAVLFRRFQSYFYCTEIVKMNCIRGAVSWSLK